MSRYRHLGRKHLCNLVRQTNLSRKKKIAFIYFQENPTIPLDKILVKKKKEKKVTAGYVFTFFIECLMVLQK